MWINKGKQFLIEANKSVFLPQQHDAWLNWLLKLLRPKNPASRSYRFLARQIETDFTEHTSCRRILFSATDSLECCNETLLMFAYFLRDELNCRVLLIDATFRQDGVSSFLRLNKALGFTDLLQDSTCRIDELIKPTAKDNIFLLPAGRVSLNGSAPLQTEKLRRLFEQLDGPFDYVLCQQDSIQQDTRYLFLAQMVDLTLLLVEEGKTLLDQLEACQKVFQAYQIANVRLIMSTSN